MARFRSQDAAPGRGQARRKKTRRKRPRAKRGGQHRAAANGRAAQPESWPVAGAAALGRAAVWGICWRGHGGRCADRRGAVGLYLHHAACPADARRARARLGHAAGPRGRGLRLARRSVRRRGHFRHGQPASEKRGHRHRGQALLHAISASARAASPAPSASTCPKGAGRSGAWRLDHHAADGQAAVPRRRIRPRNGKSEAEYVADCRRTTLWRKAKEAVYALAMEAKYTKDEILSIYLNRAYMGAGPWGRGRRAALFRQAAAELTRRRRDAGRASHRALAALRPRSASALAGPRRDGAAPDGRTGLPDRGRGRRTARANPATLSEAAEAQAGGYFADWVMESGPSLPATPPRT